MAPGWHHGATQVPGTTGRVPLRKTGDGAMPVPGADGAHDWSGWASGDALPHYVSPASGRLVNANEPDWPPDFPVQMARDTLGGWRALEERHIFDVEYWELEQAKLKKAGAPPLFAGEVVVVTGAASGVYFSLPVNVRVVIGRPE